MNKNQLGGIRLGKPEKIVSQWSLEKKKSFYQIGKTTQLFCFIINEIKPNVKFSVYHQWNKIYTWIIEKNYRKLYQKQGLGVLDILVNLIE